MDVGLPAEDETTWDRANMCHRTESRRSFRMARRPDLGIKDNEAQSGHFGWELRRYKIVIVADLRLSKLQTNPQDLHILLPSPTRRHPATTRSSQDNRNRSCHELIVEVDTISKLLLHPHPWSITGEAHRPSRVVACQPRPVFANWHVAKSQEGNLRPNPIATTLRDDPYRLSQTCSDQHRPRRGSGKGLGNVRRLSKLGEERVVGGNEGHI